MKCSQWDFLTKSICSLKQMIINIEINEIKLIYKLVIYLSRLKSIIFLLFVFKFLQDLFQ
jgi:hypothetical protein